MRPAASFVGFPVRSLQQMLRVISLANDDQISVIPDGIYGQDTAKAVSCYQRRKGLAVTGVTDRQTWDSIVEDYREASIQVSLPAPINPCFAPNHVYCSGQRDSCILLAQAMLQCMSDTYHSITPPSMSGIMDLATSESLKCFQQMCDLPSTGELDRITWYHLAKQYPLSSQLNGKMSSRHSVGEKKPEIQKYL